MNLDQRLFVLEKVVADLKQQLDNQLKEIMELKKVSKEIVNELVKLTQSTSQVMELVSFNPVNLIDKIIEDKKNGRF